MDEYDFPEFETQKTHLDNRNWIESDEEIRMVITYYRNNQNRMCYAYQEKHNLPIGGGVTEAACKNKECVFSDPDGEMPVQVAFWL